MTSLMVLKPKLLYKIKQMCFSSMTSLMVLKHGPIPEKLEEGFSSMTSLMVLKLLSPLIMKMSVLVL